MSEKSKIFAIICIFTHNFLEGPVMKNLQTLLFLALTTVLLSSCGTAYQENRMRRAAEKEAEHLAILQALADADFILDVTQIIPRGFPSRHSQGEYSLRLKGDVITTRLPYMGVSYDAPSYGGADDDISIVFEKEKVQVLRDFSKASSKGEYLFQFKGGKGKQPWTITLSIFDSGSATITCAGSGSRFMTFFANLVIPPADENQ